MHSFTIEAKALGYTSPEIIEKYENLRKYLNGNFSNVVNFLTTIKPTLTSHVVSSEDRTAQWVVSAESVTSMRSAVAKMSHYARKKGLPAVVPALEKLLLGCGLEFEDDYVTIITPQTNPEHMQLLNQNRINQVECDLEIIIDNHTFHAHKSVVATKGSFFENHIDKDRVEVKRIKKSMFPLILDFLYTGRLKINKKEIHSYQSASSHLKIESLTAAVDLFDQLQQFKYHKKTRNRSVPLVVVERYKPPDGTTSKKKITKPLDLSKKSNAGTSNKENTPVKKPKAKTPSIVLRPGKRTIKKNPKYNDGPSSPSMSDLDDSSNDSNYEEEQEEDIEPDDIEQTMTDDDNLTQTPQISNESPRAKTNRKDKIPKPIPTCLICGKKFIATKYLNKHMLKHSAGDVWPCPVCGQPSDSPDKLKEHFDSVHVADVIQYKCGIDYCDQSFESFDDLRSHKDEKHPYTTAAIISEHTEDIGDNTKPIVDTVENEDDNAKNENTEPENIIPLKKMKFGKVRITGVLKKNVEESYHKKDKELQVYVCAICDTKFNDVKTIDDHVVNHIKEDDQLIESLEPDVNGNYQCNECEEKLLTLDDVIKHKMTHRENNPFKCGNCGISFETSDALDSHIQEIHPNMPRRKMRSYKDAEYDREIVQCTQCNKSVQRKAMQAHIYTLHTPDEAYLPESWRNNKCKICGRVFRTKGRFESHMRKHTGERPWVCDHCGKGYVSREYLEAHIQKVHLYTECFCNVCGKAFKTQETLQIHRLIHEDRLAFQCDICGKNFRRQGTLQYHKRIHAFDETCEICQERVPQREIKRHMLGHTSKKEKFYCKLCNKVFFSKDNRKRHEERVHSGVRHKCDLCDKSYGNIKALRQHKRLHTGIGLQKCKVCGKEFPNKTAFKTHMYTHSTERPFICKVCGKGYKDPKNMKSHERGCQLKSLGLERDNRIASCVYQNQVSQNEDSNQQKEDAEQMRAIQAIQQSENEEEDTQDVQQPEQKVVVEPSSNAQLEPIIANHSDKNIQLLLEAMHEDDVEETEEVVEFQDLDFGKPQEVVIPHNNSEEESEELA